MEDIIKYGRYNKITEVDPSGTFFIAYYLDKVIKGTGLNNTGWDDLPHGIVKLQYRLSTGHVLNIPNYKKYLHMVEASMSIDRSGKFNSKNYHYVYIKGVGDNKVYVHKISLRNDPILGKKIGNVQVYDENIPKEMSNSWKKSIY